jgi:hypothetical protein
MKLKLPLLATFTGLAVRKQLVPNSAKKSIMDYLVEHGHVVPQTMILTMADLRYGGTAASSAICRGVRE